MMERIFYFILEKKLLTRARKDNAMRERIASKFDRFDLGINNICVSNNILERKAKGGSIWAAKFPSPCNSINLINNGLINATLPTSFSHQAEQFAELLQREIRNNKATFVTAA